MKSLVILLLFCSAFLSSCGKGKTSALSYNDSLQNQILENQRIEATLNARKKFLIEKKQAFEKINTDGQESFKNIKSIFQNKCFACHDAKTPLPPYGRIFKTINPVNQHRTDGLKSLDFSAGFPLIAKGNPPQIAILKAIRNSITGRSMPLKIYTLVYPSKKITKLDEQKILDWIDPLLAQIEDYEDRYNSGDNSVPVMAHKILELKCYRCHANGNSRGSFGDMEDTQKLLKSKYVNLDLADHSMIYTEIEKRKMPPSKLESLTVEEMNTVRDWLELEAKKDHLLK